VANIKSQIKRNRQNEKRRQRNRAVRSSLNTGEKAALAIAEEGGDATEALSTAHSQLDAAASKGVIHKNTAARRKSRLTKRVAAVSA
jgi:small subunit ribosomal protein S20